MCDSDKDGSDKDGSDKCGSDKDAATLFVGMTKHEEWTFFALFLFVKISFFLKFTTNSAQAAIPEYNLTVNLFSPAPSPEITQNPDSIRFQEQL
jgi:hypothetical protein